MVRIPETYFPGQPVYFLTSHTLWINLVYASRGVLVFSIVPYR